MKDSKEWRTIGLFPCYVTDKEFKRLTKKLEKQKLKDKKRAEENRRISEAMHYFLSDDFFKKLIK